MIFKSVAGVIVIIASAAVMTGQAAIMNAPSQAAKAGFTKLVVNEEFRHFNLQNRNLGNPAGDSTAWRQYPFLTWPLSYERIAVSNGVLTLTTQPGSHHGLATMITTMAAPPGDSKPDGPQNDFRFGYFEARLRFDPNPNNAPAFWLESVVPVKLYPNYRGNDAARYCEIDIIELNWLRPGTYMGTVHDWRAGVDTINSNHIIQPPHGTNLADWNTFGLLWQPGRVSWYMNNKLVSTATTGSICDNDRLSMVLSASKERGEEDQKLEVNWVHVYQ